MSADSYLMQMWQQMALWQLWAAPICGVAVGAIYFQSLRWSLNHLGNTKHKIRLFAGVALLRILLFFVVLVLIAQHNPVVVLLYVLAFFVTKMLIVVREKSRIVKFDEEQKNDGVV